MRRFTWLLFLLMLTAAGLFWRNHLQLRQALAMATQLAIPPAAAITAPGLHLDRAFPQVKFREPLFLTFAPGDANHVYVVTQGGVIYRVRQQPPAQTAEVFRDLHEVTRSGGEEGLLGLAFDPDYQKNGDFYVYYTPNGSPRHSELARLNRDTTERRTLLTIGQPYPNHKGGWIGFGPDGLLYVGVGDGGAGDDPQNRAQNLSELLGKLLRVTRDGKPAPGNPFADPRPAGDSGPADSRARPEIWAYGLRNPWRNAFDRATGELWVADVGQNEIEEIDIATAGGNYGWRAYEGERSNVNPEKRPASAFAPPVWSYDHSLGCSIIGGYVYRGAALPALRGKYLFSDYCSGRLWTLSRDARGRASTQQIGSVPRPTSFGEDAAGELYITSFDGNVYQLRP